MLSKLVINEGGKSQIVKLIDAIKIIEEIELNQKINEPETSYYKNREKLLKKKKEYAKNNPNKIKKTRKKNYDKDKEQKKARKAAKRLEYLGNKK